MSKNTFIKVGQMLKTVGKSGAIKLLIEDEFFEDVEKCNYLFIKNRGSYVPYFIEHFIDSNDIVVKFEDINNPEDAAKLALQDIYLRQMDIHSKYGGSIVTLTQLEDYVLYNHGVKMGTIVELRQLPQQLIAFIIYEGKEVMVPLHKSLIVSIDDQQKSIYMELPDGIFDL